LSSSNSILVRVILTGGAVHDLEFPSLPRKGEAILLDFGAGAGEVWIVEDVGYKFVSPDKTAFPVIECSEFESGDVAPSGRYDRMMAGR